MDVTYPLFMLPGVATNVTMLADALYTNNESGSGGFFGVGHNRFWHGGIHLCAKDVPIRAIADGEVIAYRMNSALKEADLGDGEPPRRFSSGFVLIKHKLLTPKGGELPCFSLYMHLKPMTSAETEQESGVNEAPHIFKKTHYVVADNRHGSGLPVMDAEATELKGVIPFGAHFVVHPNDDKCKNERYRKREKGGASHAERRVTCPQVRAARVSRWFSPRPPVHRPAARSGSVGSVPPSRIDQEGARASAASTTHQNATTKAGVPLPTA